MPIEVTILGTSSAVPTLDRHPSCQHLTIGSRHMLVDCGEAAQIQMLRYGVRASRVEKIFISHLHPDHILGLPGLLSSQSLVGRHMALHIYAPKGLKEILDTQFSLSGTYISYEVIYHELEEGIGKVVYEDKDLLVRSYSLKHRVPCWGFAFHEKKPPRRINKEAVSNKELPHEAYDHLRCGEDYKAADGTVYKVADYTLPAEASGSYGYFTDTLFLPQVAEQVEKVDLLYHEATYMEDLADKATHTCHSTALQAAKFASICQANRLIIGHFSSRYSDLSPLLEEARSLFPETMLAEEGKSFTS